MERDSAGGGEGGVNFNLNERRMIRMTYSKWARFFSAWSVIFTVVSVTFSKFDGMLFNTKVSFSADAAVKCGMMRMLKVESRVPSRNIQLWLWDLLRMIDEFLFVLGCVWCVDVDGESKWEGRMGRRFYISVLARRPETFRRSANQKTGLCLRSWKSHFLKGDNSKLQRRHFTYDSMQVVSV